LTYIQQLCHTATCADKCEVDGWSSVLRPRQHSIGYMGDGFYRSKDPTNSIKVLKGEIHYTNNRKKYTNAHNKHKTQQVP